MHTMKPGAAGRVKVDGFGQVLGPRVPGPPSHPAVAFASLKVYANQSPGLCVIQ